MIRAARRLASVVAAALAVAAALPGLALLALGAGLAAGSLALAGPRPAGRRWLLPPVRPVRQVPAGAAAARRGEAVH